MLHTPAWQDVYTLTNGCELFFKELPGKSDVLDQMSFKRSEVSDQRDEVLSLMHARAKWILRQISNKQTNKQVWQLLVREMCLIKWFAQIRSGVRESDISSFTMHVHLSILRNNCRLEASFPYRIQGLKSLDSNFFNLHDWFLRPVYTGDFCCDFSGDFCCDFKSPL